MNQLDKFKNFIEDRNENIKVGLVGAGQMGQGIVAQVSKMYGVNLVCCLLYTSPSPRDQRGSRMPSSA